MYCRIKKLYKLKFYQFGLFVCLMMFNATFNNTCISVISGQSVLLVEESGGPGENHQSVASHWQTLSDLRQNHYKYSNVRYIDLRYILMFLILLCIHNIISWFNFALICLITTFTYFRIIFKIDFRIFNLKYPWQSFNMHMKSLRDKYQYMYYDLLTAYENDL